MGRDPIASSKPRGRPRATLLLPLLLLVALAVFSVLPPASRPTLFTDQAGVRIMLFIQPLCANRLQAYAHQDCSRHLAERCGQFEPLPCFLNASGEPPCERLYHDNLLQRRASAKIAYKAA